MRSRSQRFWCTMSRGKQVQRVEGTQLAHLFSLIMARYKVMFLRDDPVNCLEPLGCVVAL